jgi:hypothetical protein
VSGHFNDLAGVAFMPPLRSPPCQFIEMMKPLRQPACHARHERAGLNSQYSMTKTFHGETLFGFLNFGHWKLFDICDLIFVILTIQ